jgi:hypothetical protein
MERSRNTCLLALFETQMSFRSPAFHRSNLAGEMAEWLKAHAWKACLLERVTWVLSAQGYPLFTRIVLRAGILKRVHFPRQSFDVGQRCEQGPRHYFPQLLQIGKTRVYKVPVHSERPERVQHNRCVRL